MPTYLSVSFNKMCLYKISKIFCLILLYNIYSVSALEDYGRYKTYKVRATTIGEIDYLAQLLVTQNFDALTFRREVGQSSDILVGPDEQPIFESLLKSQHIPYHVDINNVTDHLLKSGILLQSINPSHVAGKIVFDRFLRFSEINSYLDSLARIYPKRGRMRRKPRIEVKDRGRSFEGRPIKTILISSNMRRNNQVIFIDGGIHAREWTAIASVLYVIHMLVENYEKLQHLFEFFDFLILPVVNPDGYEYSHTGIRMWRKTRSVQGRGCYGVDGNRNYDFHWSKNRSSNLPCSPVYHGPQAFSEPETRIVRDIMLQLSEKISLYVSVHAYGSYLLTPWGHTRALPKNWDVIEPVAKAAVDTVQMVHNKEYKYGPTSRLMYDASGLSNDYALAIAKIPIPITLEVQEDGHGFDPPASKILSIAKESWTCIKAMTEYLDNSKSRLLQQKNAKDRLIGTSWLYILLIVQMICSELLV